MRQQQQKSNKAWHLRKRRPCAQVGSNLQLLSILPYLQGFLVFFVHLNVFIQNQISRHSSFDNVASSPPFPSSRCDIVDMFLHKIVDVTDTALIRKCYLDLAGSDMLLSARACVRVCVCVRVFVCVEHW